MPAPLSQRLRKDTQFEINGEDDTGTPEKLTTPSYPVATRECALGESTTPLDHNAIQERALGVLSLMDSMPCTWVGTKTDRATQERDYKRTPQPTPTQASIENTVCAVCNKTDLGLLFCDRCIETTSLYHPHCLLVLPYTNERICDMCNGTQTSQTNPPHDPTQKKKLDSTAIDKHHGKIPDKDLSDKDTSSSSSSSSIAHDPTQKKPDSTTAIDKQQGKTPGKDLLDDATLSSSSSSSIQAYSPKFQTRATQLSATAPPYLTKAHTDRSTKNETPSPRLTRAAKKAAENIPPINYGGTNDESDNNESSE